ncbi:MAG: hypothetical protein ACTSWF_07735 [Candidatus Freyarchaeota archaeon]
MGCGLCVANCPAYALSLKGGNQKLSKADASTA